MKGRKRGKVGGGGFVDTLLAGRGRERKSKAVVLF